MPALVAGIYFFRIYADQDVDDRNNYDCDPVISSI